MDTTTDEQIEKALFGSAADISASAQADGDPGLPPMPPGFRMDDGPISLPAHLMPAGLMQAPRTSSPFGSAFMVVRYVDAGERHRAALIVDVEGDLATLSVFLPGASHVEPQAAVPYDPLGKTPHSWH